MVKRAVSSVSKAVVDKARKEGRLFKGSVYDTKKAASDARAAGTTGPNRGQGSKQKVAAPKGGKKTKGPAAIAWKQDGITCGGAGFGSIELDLDHFTRSSQKDRVFNYLTPTSVTLKLVPGLFSKGAVMSCHAMVYPLSSEAAAAGSLTIAQFRAVKHHRKVAVPMSGTSINLPLPDLDMEDMFFSHGTHPSNDGLVLYYKLECVGGDPTETTRMSRGGFVSVEVVVNAFGKSEASLPTIGEAPATAD